MHSSLSIANNILALAQKNKEGLTPLKLMKLVYLSHGWYLGEYRKPLIKEPMEAWQYGPVIRNLYQAIKEFGSLPVSCLLTHNEEDTKDSGEEELVQRVYNYYEKFSAIKLSTLTHEIGSPWEITWNLYGKNGIISNDLIQDFYENQDFPKDSLA